LRFMQIGAVTIVALVATIAVWGTVAKLGPFTAYTSVEHNLILLHTFILVAAIMAMLTAIMAGRQRQTEKALRTRNKQLKESNRRVNNLLYGALEEPISKLRSKIRLERRDITKR
jgi:uncharacterized membrane protein